MFKMMEQGQLLASDVLPKVATEMKKVAAVGLESKLDTLRVAQGQFTNELQKAGKTIFDAGFSDGLKDLLFLLTDFLRENERYLTGLGKIFQFIFNVIRTIAAVIVPVIGTLSFLLGEVAELMNTVFFSSNVGHIAFIAAAIYGLVKANKALNAVLRTQLALRLKNLLFSKAGLALMGVAAFEDLYMTATDPTAKTVINPMGKEEKGGITGTVNTLFGYLPSMGFGGFASNIADQFRSMDSSRNANKADVNVNIKTEDGLEGRIQTVVEQNNANAKVTGDY